MKHISCYILLCALAFLCFNANAQTSEWVMKKERIVTSWSEQVDPSRPLPEYPRPQLVRENWQNLNGLWNYRITAKSESMPDSYNGKILVPFAIESALSGVGKTVGKDSMLWYNTRFTLPRAMKGKKILLHFGAVDWKAEVFLNGQSIGVHEGGYDPFSIDISPFLKKGEQELTVSVWDPTDKGPQPRGKQVAQPKSIWYTPVTGIWQTVWLEAVPQTFVREIRPTPDIDRQILALSVDVFDAREGDRIRAIALDGQTIVAESETLAGTEVLLKIDKPKLWLPDDPFLYDLQITALRNGKPVDQVKSYFAMRKSSIGIDANGIKRMLLNNRFVFQYGPLDQGWWPDGLYTAPTDEALKFDIEKTKKMGFNMIRKHVKVEPARWYYHCDKLGMLVWQDMPSGDLGNRWNSRPGVYGLATEKERSPESEAYYRKEWNAIIDALYPFPSIVVWTPFNEAWGQFKTEEIAKWTAQKDPSRLVNIASGGNFFPVGDIIDLHNYPEPAMPRPDLFGEKQALVLGEFGGLGLPVKGHVWQEQENWGYQSFTSETALYDRYASFIDALPGFIKNGLSAAVYTQTTDVEIEVNGLMTYDRKVVKMAADKLRKIHQQLYDPALVEIK